jgi:hypothetical protein
MIAGKKTSSRYPSRMNSGVVVAPPRSLPEAIVGALARGGVIFIDGDVLPARPATAFRVEAQGPRNRRERREQAALARRR